MKKIIIAPLAAFVCSTTMAIDLPQTEGGPQVSVFGVIDVNTAYVNKDTAGHSQFGIGSSGNSSSRLGFKASQEINGLTVGGHLEGAIHADDGTVTGAGSDGFAFKRRATLSLGQFTKDEKGKDQRAGFGEVRFGRDLTPSYSEVSKYDPFGGNGIGQFQGWTNWGKGAGAEGNGVRASNMLAYYSPSYAGFSYGVGYAAAEDKDKIADQLNRYAGLFVDYKIAGFNTTLAYGSQRDDLGNKDASNPPITTEQVDRNELTFGASYDLQVVKPSILFQQTQYKEAKDSGYGDTYKITSFAVGAAAPIGKDVIKVQFAHYQDNDDADKAKANQFAVGYVNNQTDNFALYGILAYIKGDKDGGNLGLGLPATNVYIGTAEKTDDAQFGLQLGATFKF